MNYWKKQCHVASLVITCKRHLFPINKVVRMIFNHISRSFTRLALALKTSVSEKKLEAMAVHF